MGTFHSDKSELHGITIVVETDDAQLYVGRCDDMDEQQVILLDADLHQPEEGGPSSAEYLERAARFGIWKKFDRISIDRARVTGVRRLGEI